MTKLDRITPEKLKGNPRATHSAWLKYESVILTAYRLHPKPYIYRPGNMSPATVSSRVRDALRGKLAFDWPNGDGNSITKNELTFWYAQIIIKHDSEQVYIGCPEAFDAVLTSDSTPEKISTLRFLTLDFEEIAAFQLLLSRNRIVGPIYVTQPPDLTLLPPRPNTEKVTMPNGELMLL